MKNSVPQSQEPLSTAQQPHVAGGYYTGQHRHRTFPLSQKELWDRAEQE